MKLAPLVTSSARGGPGTTVGVPHEGSSSRSVRHSCLPVAASIAGRKSSPWVSHWTWEERFETLYGRWRGFVDD
jgi:hypothetical protein